MQAWDLVRKEHLDQKTLNNGLEKVRKGASLFAGAVTWEDVRREVEAHDIRSEAECFDIIRDMLAMIGDRYVVVQHDARRCCGFLRAHACLSACVQVCVRV